MLSVGSQYQEMVIARHITNWEQYKSRNNQTSTSVDEPSTSLQNGSSSSSSSRSGQLVQNSSRNLPLFSQLPNKKNPLKGGKLSNYFSSLFLPRRGGSATLTAQQPPLLKQHSHSPSPHLPPASSRVAKLVNGAAADGRETRSKNVLIRHKKSLRVIN